MRTAIVSFFVVSLMAAGAAADVLVKQVVRLEPYYDAVPQGGTDTAFDLWFGTGKLAVVTPEARVVFDPAARRIFAVSTRDSSYCEIELPVNRDSVLASDYKARIDRWYFEGSVSKGGEEKTIDGRRCASYRCERWIQLGDDKFNESERALWLTTDMPFDWKLHKGLQDAILSLARNSDSLLEAMKKLQGFTVAGEIVVYDMGNKITSTVNTLTVEESAAPEGCYSVPSYYKKKARLAREDFLALLQLVY
jgi:hypothetical protein